MTSPTILKLLSSLFNNEMWIVYCALNKTNGNRYIGSTKHFSQRKVSHLNKLAKNQHSNKSWQADYNKKHLFHWSIEAIFADKKSALLSEMKLVSSINGTCYNIKKRIRRKPVIRKDYITIYKKDKPYHVYSY